MAGWLGIVFGPYSVYDSINDLNEFIERISTFDTVTGLTATQLHQFRYRNIILAAFVINVMTSMICTVSSVALVHGVYQKKAKFVKLFLVALVLEYLLEVASQMMLLSGATVTHTTNCGSAAAAILFIGLVTMGKTFPGCHAVV